MTFLRQFSVALRALLVLTVLLGVAYPLGMTAVGRLVAERSDGSLVRVDGRVVGSGLIGQAVTGDRWFQGRPSATDYDGSSGASNYGPSNPDLRTAVAQRETALKAANPDAVGPIPADALTASASGLDPDISPAYARWQAPRVAKARHLPVGDVERLIAQHTDEPALGFIGNASVNVLALNQALAGLPSR